MVFEPLPVAQNPIQVAALFALAIAVLLEVHWFSPAVIPIPASPAAIPEAYTEMRSDPTEGLCLIFHSPFIGASGLCVVSKEHQRPIPWGLNDPMPRSLIQITSA